VREKHVFNPPQKLGKRLKAIFTYLQLRVNRFMIFLGFSLTTLSVTGVIRGRADKSLAGPIS